MEIANPLSCTIPDEASGIEVLNKEHTAWESGRQVGYEAGLAENLRGLRTDMLEAELARRKETDHA